MGSKLARMPAWQPAARAGSTPRPGLPRPATPLTLTSSPAFSSAICTDLTRLGCPLPIPSSLPSLATVMALDLTCFTHSLREGQAAVGGRAHTRRGSASGSAALDGHHAARHFRGRP